MRAGQDALIRIEVDLNEACFGTERTITLESAVICPKCTGNGCADNSTPQTCPICKGRGETQQVTRSFIGQVMTSRPCNNCGGYGSTIPNPCRECSGDGRVRARQSIDIKVPPGVETGNRIQMSGRGEVGAGGGPAGDLYVEIVETPHETLMRDGDTLHLALSVSMVAATLGTKVQVETLDGLIEVEVKPGTQSGATITVKGKGVTHLRRGTRGDLIVHVEVKTPTKLNKAEEELMRKFSELRGEKAGEVEIKEHDQGFFHKLRDAFGR
jgi:molecular chaperone DnaJ